MENLPGQRDTVRLTITSRPEPRVMIDGYDLTGSVSSIWLHMDGIEAKAVIEVVGVDVELDADMTEATVQHVPPPDANLVPVTADEIEEVLVTKGLSEKGGEAVYQHLLSRGAIVPDSDGAPGTTAGSSPVSN